MVFKIVYVLLEYICSEHLRTLKNEGKSMDFYLKVTAKVGN